MSRAFFNDSAPGVKLPGDYSIVTGYFYLAESEEEIIPDLLTFYYGGEGFKFKLDYYKGWIKKVEWSDINHDDRCVFIKRDGNMLFKINKNGKKIIKYIYRDIPLTHVE